MFAAAREAPERLALVEPGRAWSYAELALLCRQALGWLCAKGVAPSDSAPDVVAVLAEPTPHQIAMTFAVMAAGVPCLPVHPRLTEPERTALLDQAGATLLVDAAWQHDPTSPAAPEPPQLVRGRAGEALLALVQTSGTTADPRLAMLSRRAFQASAAANAAHLGWTDDDRWLLALPFAHIGGLSILTRCLAARRTVALAGLPPGAVAGQSAALVADRMNGLGATLLSLVPTQLEQLLELGTWSAPSSLRAVLVGGAAVSEATLERARARGLPVLPTYGMTETCSQICTRAV
ncbi:MAG TPA: AMP-binding protein, partial [Polyangiales bacterium]